MTHRGHTGGGIVAGLLTVKLMGASSLFNFALLPLATLAALIPDIDHGGSWIARRLPPAYALYKWGLSNPLTWRLWGKARAERMVGHRTGLSHTLLGALVSSLLFGGAAFLGLHALLGHGWLPAELVALGGWSMRLASLSPVLPHAVALGAAWLLGFLSHIALDMLTVSGVALFYPWRATRYGLLPKELRITMGKWGVTDG